MKDVNDTVDNDTNFNDEAESKNDWLIGAEHIASCSSSSFLGFLQRMYFIDFQSC